MRSLTERGLTWVLVSLIFAVAANAVLFTFLFVDQQGGVGGPASALLAIGIWEILLFAGVIPGYLGFRSLRSGRGEFNPSNALGARIGTTAFFVGAAGAVASVATGLILAFVYVPQGAYTSGLTPSAAWPVIVGDSIRGIHRAAPTVIALFVGIFLLESVWRQSTPLGRILAGSALGLGIAEPVLGLAFLEIQVFPLPLGTGLALEALPAISLALWASVYLLVLRHLRGAALARVSGAAST